MESLVGSLVGPLDRHVCFGCCRASCRETSCPAGGRSPGGGGWGQSCQFRGLFIRVPPQIARRMPGLPGSLRSGRTIPRFSVIWVMLHMSSLLGGLPRPTCGKPSSPACLQFPWHALRGGVGLFPLSTYITHRVIYFLAGFAWELFCDVGYLAGNGVFGGEKLFIFFRERCG